MARIRFATICFVLACTWCASAKADVLVRISIATQKMHVYVDGTERYVWPVATARRGMRTPTGTFYPVSFDAHHKSGLYGGAPMPHSIFFSGNYAIHGSYGTVGVPASHGCVRLYPEHAAILFDLVRAQSSRTKITISGS